MQRYDVVVAGAGIIGLCIGWQLARRSRLRIAVLEKGAAVGEGSTGASSAVCRHRYSLDEVVYLARDGIDAYRHWPQFTGLAKPRAGLNEDGVLWLPGADRAWADREHARMQGLAIPTQVLDDDDIRTRFPALNTCTLPPNLDTGEPHDCDGGGRSLFEPTGGYVDPVSAAQDLVEACRTRSNIDVRFRTRVAGLDTRGDRLRGVTLDNGDTIETPLLVNATGPWFRHLCDLAGLSIKWDLAPVRIQVLYCDRPPEVEGHIPVTVDMAGGIYFRTQNRGQQIVLGSVLEEDEREVVADPERFLRVADDEFEMLKTHTLQHRLPALSLRSKPRSYCGLYTMNRDDVHPVLGPTELEGFWSANGFSGHGFKLAPAIGSMFAQAITGERSDLDTDQPLSLFASDRTPLKLDAKNVLA